MKVIKRNNTIEDFELNKIRKAISEAMLAVDAFDSDLLDLIVSEVYEDLQEEDILAIEEIQDVIENILIKNNMTTVAKEYILYRNERKQIRDKQASLYESSQKEIENILNAKAIENANANVDESSFSGKNAKITSHFLKEYALNNLMDPEVAQAHRDGLLYTHDLDNYANGMHNCLNVDFQDLFENQGGFQTRNGDARKPNDIMTFFQLVAVVFQCESQCQFGGVGANKIDYDAAPYVKITFKKAFKDALMDVNEYSEEKAKKIVDSLNDICELENEELIRAYPKLYKIAKRHTERKTLQAAESLYHNLNTLESRAGSQVPFTSINFGTDISPEGRLVSKSLLQASINGIGKHYTTSIFPISIFKHKKGVNADPGDPNYDLKQLAIKSLSKRIYPNFANLDAYYMNDAKTPDEEFSTMGCRTLTGFDRHGLGYGKGGRGNIAPITMNIVDMAIRFKDDIEGFWKELDRVLLLAEKGLLNRFEWIASQKAKSGFFLHQNGLMKNTLGRKLDPNEQVKENMKHSSLAIGYCGIAEACKVLFGKTHGESDEAYEFAYNVVKHINEFTKIASDRNDLNFSCYATPAESTAMTFRNKLFEKYGLIEGVTDREYVTNSHHIPVYQEISIFEKIQKERPFQELANGGCIMYVELESAVSNNLEAIEKIINYAMSNDIAYFALNFPIDTCKSCGYSAEINEDHCPKCGSDKIERLRRVTGYLTTDYRNFNAGKQAEVRDRVKHSKYKEG